MKQMQACEGYFENGRFYPLEKVEQTSGRRRAFLTILDEPARNEDIAKNKHAKAWREFLEEIEKIDDEPVPEFERVKFREIEDWAIK
jgi:predicted DNA-binding antitoxin AbrB/MazE fold protein